MKQLLLKYINRCLKALGLYLSKLNMIEKLDHECSLYENLYIELIRLTDSCNVNSTEGIVFSKDRALQLHALLGSYYEQASYPVKLHVLFIGTTSAHQEAYAEVQKMFSSKSVEFMAQRSAYSFREDLIGIINRMNTNRLFFLVDDIVFIELLNLDLLVSFDPTIFVPSLRMGLNLSYCYPMQKEQPLPSQTNNVLECTELFSWRWKDGVLDWNYPLSVDGHIYNCTEIKAMLQLIDFNAPNSLESALQKFKFVFLKRKGLAYRKSRIVNLPFNKVQAENDNISGNLHQDQLLLKWQEGRQMDYRHLYGADNISAHQDLQIEFISRTDNGY